MLDLGSWAEVAETVRKNRLRSALTAFSVAWGIFILVVLLGSGEGLANGAEYQFRDDATNSIWVWPGQTSMPHLGLPAGRPIQMTNEDIDETRARVDGVEHITGRFFIQGRVTVTRGKETGTFDIRSVHPAHQYLERTRVVRGRFINDLDIAGLRKTAAIGVPVAKALFGAGDPIGGSISVNGIAFQVVGVFEDDGGQNEMEKIYLPITTAQRTFNGANRVSAMLFTVGDADLEESKRIAGQTRDRLAARHRFRADDTRAVFVSNNVESYQRFRSMIGGIRAFVWAIGVGTILAGVVGVSNIMLISVRERTREIGVRKALGATPLSILGLVLQEAIAITAFAGLLGLLLGVAVLDVAARLLPPDSSYFRNPSVDLAVAVQATLVLVVAGLLAGLVPARRAAAVLPVEALRYE